MDICSVGTLNLLKEVRSRHRAVEEFHRGLGESLDVVIAKLENGVEGEIGGFLCGNVSAAGGFGGGDADADLGLARCGLKLFESSLLGVRGVRIASEYGDLMYDPETIKGIRKMPDGVDALLKKYGELDIIEVAKLFLTTGISRAKKGDADQKIKTVTSSLYAMIRTREDLRVDERVIGRVVRGDEVQISGEMTDVGRAVTA